MDERRLNWLFALLAIAIILGLICAPDKLAAQGSQAAPAAASSQYVGSDTCKGCHEEVFTKGFQPTKHFRLTQAPDSKYPGHGCESCHGPGAAHVEAGGDKTKIISFKNLSAAEASKQCLSCHSQSQGHTNFSRTAHGSNGVGCIGCHSAHKAKEAALLTQKQPQLCYSCHGAAKADFAKPFRHRVNEGYVQCSDCHNVHGSTLARNLNSTPGGDAVCFKCHTEKKGPYVFEHTPVKAEGCSACHTPHGSTNKKLLRVSNVNVLCLQCHTLSTEPPQGPAHNQAQKYQACTMCHAYVHGSNFSEVFFKP